MTLQKNNFILLLIFIYAISMVTVASVATLIHFLLLMAGLAFSWRSYGVLNTSEKRVFSGFVLFFILILLSFFYTQDIDSGLKELGRYIRFPLLIPMYLLLRKLNLETGKIFFFGLLVALLVLFGQATYETLVLGWSRAVGVKTSIMMGYASILIAVTIMCSLLTVYNGRRYYIIGALFILLALTTCGMSGTKGAWLFFPVSVIWFIWVKRKSIGQVPLISIVISIIILLWAVSQVDQVEKRIDAAINDYQISSNDSSKSPIYKQNASNVGSIGVRWEMWRNSITIWKKSPLLGTGVGDFQIDSAQLFESGQSTMRGRFAHAHSIYLHILATSGLVGLFAMLVFLLIMPFRMFLSYWNTEEDTWVRFYSLAGMTFIIAFAVFGLTDGWLFKSIFIHMYLMFFLVFMSSINVRKNIIKTSVV